MNRQIDAHVKWEVEREKIMTKGKQSRYTERTVSKLML